MAIKPGESYPTKTAAASSSYPYGKAQDITSPGDGTGTPWTALVVNDWFGFFQGLLVKASITPTGDSDTAIASQYIDALDALYDQSADGSTSVKGLLKLSDDSTSTSTALAATINAVARVNTALTPVVTGDASAWTVHWGKLKMQGGTYSIPPSTTHVFTLASAYTSVHLFFTAWIRDSGGVDENPMKAKIVNLSSGSVQNTDRGTIPITWMSFGVDS